MRVSVDRWRRILASPWQRGAIAVAAGALPALTFPKPSLWWLAYVVLVPWLLLLRTAPTGRRAAYDGWLGGIGFMLAVHHWLLPYLHVFIVVLALLLGLLWAPWGWLVRRLLGGAPGAGRAAAALVVVPSGWLMVELVRSWQYLGGPWGLLGASQWQVPPALRMASLGGVWLVSFLLVAVNTAVAMLIAMPRVRRIAAVGVLACAVVVGGSWAWGPRPPRTGTAHIAVVQPGLIDGVGSTGHRFAREAELTRTLAGRQMDLVVWGESSIGADLRSHTDLENRLAAISRDVHTDLLVNVDARRSDRPGIYKSSVLIGPDGLRGQRYDKIRLVPFGEYIPARPVLGWATSVGKAAAEDRRRGREPVVMTLPAAGRLQVGPLVCFESAFPDMSRRLARRGAEVLIAQSATSSFQNSWAPQQHASLAALRAAETWRPMVHATLTGVSAVYGPRGQAVDGWIGTSASTARVYDVPLGGGTSPYVRYGDWVVFASIAVLVAFGAAEGLRPLGSRIRRRPGPAPRSRPARTPHGSATRPRR